MESLNAALIEDIKTKAKQTCLELTKEMTRSVRGVGDHDLNREERIARFVDYAQRGVLDALQGIGAPVYDDLVREYVQDMSNSPYMKEQ